MLWAASPYASLGLLVAALIFYVWLSPPIALGMAVISAAMLLPLAWWQPGRGQALVVALGVFIAAWIGQFIGHRIEGRKPSFFQDLKFLLVGPAWLLGFVYRRWGIRY
jgi:uncharacterized membrane protein YGL010W